MFAIVKTHVIALAVQAILGGVVDVEQADPGKGSGGVRATWTGTAEIHLECDEDGEISFDSPYQLHLDGKVKIETEQFQVEADRVSFESATGRLVLESREPGGARLALRAHQGGHALRVVGRRLVFRFPDKSLAVEGAGGLQMRQR